MASILKFSSFSFLILLAFESFACSCAAIYNFCDLHYSDNDASILLLAIKRDSFYGNIGPTNIPQYYDAKIVETLFGPDIGLDSITFMSSFPDCEFSMTDIMDTIILKVETFEVDTNAHYPITYMLTPCLNNFFQVQNTNVFGNFYYERYTSQHLDTMSYEQFMEWYPNCSAIIATKDFKEFSEIDVFPNPVLDILNVKNNSSNKVTFSLYNGNGVLIINGTISLQSQEELDTNELPTGIYYLRLEDGIRQKNRKILKL